MKRNLLLIALFFVCVKSHGIIFWQPYPITAVVTSNGSQNRVECSVWDSLMGSWVYYNTPWYNDTVDLIGSTSTIKVFQTAKRPFNSWTGAGMDSVFGYIIYDQIVHQFAPVLTYFSMALECNVPFANIWASNDMVGTDYQHCYLGSEYGNKNAFMYDVLSHAWIGGPGVWTQGSNGGISSMNISVGAFVSFEYNDDLFDPYMWCNFYDPVQQTFIQFGHYGWPYIANGGGNQDLYYLENDYALTNGNVNFETFDAYQHSFGGWGTRDANVIYSVATDIGYAWDTWDNLYYFGIYDDSLHHAVLDTVSFHPANIKMKDHVVAYSDPAETFVYYEAFSPTQRMWIKDSTSTVGVGSISISYGTVYWIDSNSVSHFVGYNDTTGWGNFYTPPLLNFHITDFYSSTGYPLIYVKNYSIGTESVWYDFGDGIISPTTQRSLWHLYKVNGNYSASATPYTVCINANTSAGIQTWCDSRAPLCSADFNFTSGCVSNCNGSASVTPLSGNAPFSFSWSTSASTDSVSSLCFGNYTVTMTDTLGCNVTHQFILDDTLSMTSAITSVSCFGVCNGEAIVFPSGGTPPYAYSWNTGDTTSTLFNLCAGGVYVATVHDANQCTVTRTCVITQPSQLTYIDLYNYNPSCWGCTDGEIDFCADHGTGPYSMTWTPNIGSLNNMWDTCFQIYNLPAGIYTFTITDNNGCTLTFIDSLVDPPNFIQNLNQQTIFEISPNPTKGKFSVISSEAGEIEIYNPLGEKMFNFVLRKNKETINIEIFPPGIYFLKFVSSKGTIERKFVKAE